jgi:hypothetical protein
VCWAGLSWCLLPVGQTVFVQSPAAYTVLCVEQNIYDIFFLGCRQIKVLNIANKMGCGSSADTGVSNQGLQLHNFYSLTNVW